MSTFVKDMSALPKNSISDSLCKKKPVERNILMKRVGSNKHNEVVNNNFSSLTVTENQIKSLIFKPFF